MTTPGPYHPSALGGAAAGQASLDGSDERTKLSREAQSWTIASLASAVFACSCGFGLIGGLLCYMASLALAGGNVEDARAKLRLGKLVTIVGAVMGLATALFWVVFQIADLL